MADHRVANSLSDTRAVAVTRKRGGIRSEPPGKATIKGAVIGAIAVIVAAMIGLFHIPGDDGSSGPGPTTSSTTTTTTESPVTYTYQTNASRTSVLVTGQAKKGTTVLGVSWTGLIVARCTTARRAPKLW